MWKLTKVLFLSCFLSVSSAQLWDLSYWGDEDEGNDSSDEGSGDIWTLEDEEENIVKLIKMSTTQIKEEKQLLEQSSAIIVNEITSELHDDLIEANMNQISDIISDHTVDLFNTLHILKSNEDEKLRKLKIHDIFVWSNDSTDKINEIIESYYQT